MLLTQLLGPLGLENPPHALVFETLCLDLLESLDFGFGRLLGGGVGVALVLQLVLFVLQLLSQTLQVGRRNGVLVHRRGRAVRGGGDELVRHDLLGRCLRSFEDRHPGCSCRQVPVDGDLLGGAAQLLDIGLQGVVLGLQLTHLLVELVELDARLSPCRGSGVGLIAGILNLRGGTRRGVVVTLGGRPRPDTKTKRWGAQRQAEHREHESCAAPGHGAKCSRCVSVG